MRKPSNHAIGNMDWKMRNYGYQAATRPTAEDVARIVAENTVLRFTKSQMQEFLESAEYAYSMQLRHRAERV